MHIRQVTQSRQAYIPWLQELQDFGLEVEVRGRHTKEFINAITVVREPWHHCILIPSRRWNPWLALSEALWIIAGRDDIASIQPYNSSISNYSDDGSHLYGAYGARIYHQIDPLIERLRRDPSDRAAILQIWDSMGDRGESLKYHGEDLTENTLDRPCNNMVYFKLRENKLHMTVMCRSNDLHWGLMAVNLPTFGILQSYIAARLGVQMGEQTHFSNSLHIYTDEPRAQAITDRMLYQETEDMPRYPIHEKLFDEYDYQPNKIHNHDEVAFMCSSVLDNKALPKEWPSFYHWAKAFLTAYRDKTELPDYIQFLDWTVAAQLFMAPRTMKSI